MAELITQRIPRNAAKLRLHAVAANPDEVIDRAEHAQVGYRAFLDVILEFRSRRDREPPQGVAVRLERDGGGVPVLAETAVIVCERLWVSAPSTIIDLGCARDSCRLASLNLTSAVGNGGRAARGAGAAAVR